MDTTPVVLWLEPQPNLVSNEVLDEVEKGMRVKVHVVGVNDVDSAWDFLLTHKDQLVGLIMEIIMPVGDLFKALEELCMYGRETGVWFARKARLECPTLPILYFSYVTDPDIKRRAGEVGITTFLGKPQDLTKLAKVCAQSFHL